MHFNICMQTTIKVDKLKGKEGHCGIFTKILQMVMLRSQLPLWYFKNNPVASLSESNIFFTFTSFTHTWCIYPMRF